MQVIGLIFCLTLLIQLHFSNGGDPCPPPGQLRFCSCTRKESASRNQSNLIEDSIRKRADSVKLGSYVVYTMVVCNLTRTISALEEDVALGLHRRQVDKLTVYSIPPEKEHTLSRLPGGWLKNTRVRHLEFQLLDSRLSGDFMWYGNPFEEQEQSLLILTASNCSLFGALTYETLGTVNTKKLDTLPNIEVIDFSKNLLSVITASAFQRPSANLSTIILSRNSIERIESGAFKHVVHLKSVDLSHNLLKALSRGVFAAPARALVTLNLSWNYLKVIPTDYFTNMPSLKSVSLEKNFLYSLPERPWHPVWSQLSFVNIEGNFIKCDCNLLWLARNTSDATTTYAPSGYSNRVFKGTCSFYRLPISPVMEYSLNNLKKESLMC